jgi:hypothetical protein
MRFQLKKKCGWIIFFFQTIVRKYQQPSVKQSIHEPTIKWPECFVITQNGLHDDNKLSLVKNN